MINHQEIKNIIEEILKRIPIKYEEVRIIERENIGSKIFSIKTGESGMLIGNKGENLFALNHIIKRIARKNAGEETELEKFVVDVNDYQDRLMDELRNKAKIMCERARSFKVDITLDPMSSYERMLVHSCLENEPDVKTESVGEGKERKVVIRYITE
jgi:spoIIIJ-associated protein